MNDTNYINMNKTAEMLDVHPKSIYRWVRRGFFPNHIQIGEKGIIRIALCDIQAFKGKAALPEKQQ